MTRDPSIILPVHEPRCVPSTKCPIEDACARAKAPIPLTGASIIDGMACTTMLAGCVDFLPIPDKVAPAKPKVPPKKHWSEVE